jgi:hypothetical protein
MPNLWITDLSHFLAVNGSIGPKAGPAKRLADYLTKIVVDATTVSPTFETPTVVRCRRRPGRKPCGGEIETDIDPDTDQVLWWCPVCGDEGSISNWQGYLWDCSQMLKSH